MYQLMKEIMESNRELDKVLESKDNAIRLKTFKKMVEQQIKLFDLCFRGQKILRQLKQDSKESPYLESLVGPMVEKKDLKALQEMKKQMKEKIMRLKEKIAMIENEGKRG